MSANRSADQHEIEEFEERTHSFIVKVWLEETMPTAGRPVWYGRITHVPSGRRRYFRNLSDIVTFVAPYLKGMGVEFSLWARIRHCWGKLNDHTRANDVSDESSL